VRWSLRALSITTVLFFFFAFLLIQNIGKIKAAKKIDNQEKSRENLYKLAPEFRRIFTRRNV
jgi:hypothetical protein